MSQLDADEVRAIAQLARLSLSDRQVEELRVELSAILDHMDALAEVDTSSVAPMTHALPMTLRLRTDSPEPSLEVDLVLAGAPRSADECFEVPPVIRKGSGS